MFSSFFKCFKPTDDEKNIDGIVLNVLDETLKNLTLQQKKEFYRTFHELADHINNSEKLVESIKNLNLTIYNIPEDLPHDSLDYY